MDAVAIINNIKATTTDDKWVHGTINNGQAANGWKQGNSNHGSNVFHKFATIFATNASEMINNNRHNQCNDANNNGHKLLKNKRNVSNEHQQRALFSI